MVKKLPEKRRKAYAFRQFQRTTEKERKELTPKSGKQKKEIIEGYGRVSSQVITYKKHKYSRIVYRDSKGRFTKIPKSKIVSKEEFRKPKKFFGESKYYRASVFIEVPYQSNKAIGINNYFWFGITIIDKEENINIDDLKEELIQILEKELHYKRSLLDWFDWEHPAIEYPKPYPANRPQKFYETWSKTHK